ncbi:MAG: sensor domain-containing diguanylate cyclase [Burkholderiaceae bacterium]
MTFEPSRQDAHCELPQTVMTAQNLTLAHIARSAPLAQSLTCIVNGIEAQYPDISGAIFLLSEDDNCLHLSAAPSLHQDYNCAFESIPIEVEAELRQHTRDGVTEVAARNMEASRCWCILRDVALQHGLYLCSIIPIWSATNRLFGIFVAHAHKPGCASDWHQHALVDAMVLASIAIERNHNEIRLKKAENILRESETRMSLAIEGSGTGIWDRNVLTGEMHYSPGWKAIVGCTDAKMSKRIEDSYARVHPDDLAFVQAAIQAHFDQKTESYAVEHRIHCKDGNYKWVSSRGKVVSRDIDGKPLRMIGTTNDITAMRALSDKLQQSVDLITNLTNEVPGCVYQYQLLPSGEGFFTYVSEGVRDIYELTPEQVVDNFALIDGLIHPDDFENFCTSFDASVARLTPWHIEYRVILPVQGLRWRREDARPRRLQDGTTLWHGFISDVTERKSIEIELHEFATIDFLTRLPNRRCFMAKMEQELARIQRFDDIHTAVLMCDLDHFKIINDSHGHAIGDLVLKHFATILGNALRKNDAVGRIGGEEFAVVLSGAGVAEATAFAQRVQQQIAETPLVAGDKTISVTVSIGIAVMAATDASADAPLNRSDLALYRAKENGRNRIEAAIE